MLNTYRRVLGSVIKSEYLNLVEENFDEDQWLEEVNKEAIIDITQPAAPCIFSVPQTLMNDNPEAYIPQIVSLGPYHFGKPELKAMEKHKSEAVRRIQRRMGPTNFTVIVEKIKSMQEKIKRCYDRDIACNGEILSWMMARDGSFLLEFLRSYARIPAHDSVSRDCHPIFGENFSLETKGIRDDVVKLENQIPLFVLKEILTVELRSEQSAKKTLAVLVRFFCDWGTLFGVPSGENATHLPPHYRAATIMEIFHSMAASDWLEQTNSNWMPDFICNYVPGIPKRFQHNDARENSGRISSHLIGPPKCSAAAPQLNADEEISEIQESGVWGGDEIGGISLDLPPEKGLKFIGLQQLKHPAILSHAMELKAAHVKLELEPPLMEAAEPRKSNDAGEGRAEMGGNPVQCLNTLSILSNAPMSSTHHWRGDDAAAEPGVREAGDEKGRISLDLPPEAGVKFKALKELKHPEILPRAVELEKNNVKFKFDSIKPPMLQQERQRRSNDAGDEMLDDAMSSTHHWRGDDAAAELGVREGGDEMDRISLDLTEAGVKFEGLKELKHPEMLPRAVELKKTGVKFKAFKGSISNIRFKKRSSTLLLPVISAGPLADTMLRNLVAFECSSASSDSKLPITKYVQFMDELIDNEMDVALLRENGIVRSSVGRDTLIAELFNPVERIALYTPYEPIDNARKGLLDHQRRTWKIGWYQYYEANCSRSWLVISGLAAFALIVMTFFQAGCLFVDCNPKHWNLYH